MFPGVDPKLLQSLDPKTMDALMDPKMMASMYGLDPKKLANMDPKMLQAYGLDPKWFDPKNMGMDLKTFQELILEFWDWILKCFREWIPSSFSLWRLI